MLFLLLLFFTATLAKIDEHRVESLPHQNIELRSKHYSGLIELSSPHQGRFVHYIFIEAESESQASAPVTVWFNGGPGCSSLEGLFTENGPYSMDPMSGKLTRNHFSWTRRSNMLYIEQPVGVGFSYTTTPIELNDTIAAQLNLNFLVQWYASYPEYKNNDLYISGESYAGIYIPMFADEILRKSTYNLKGVLVGNGCSGSETASCGLDPSVTYFSDSPGGLQLRLAYDHALISKAAFLNVTETCNNTVMDQDQHCYVTRIEGDPLINETFCWQFNSTAWDCVLTNETNPYFDCCYALWNSEDNMGDINIYSIYGDCLPDPNASASLKTHRRRPRRRRRLSIRPPPRHGWSGCWGSDAALTLWLNNEDVRKAFHVDSSPLDWKVCQDFPLFNYTKTQKSVVDLYVV